MLRAGVLLGLFAVLGSGLVSYSYEATKMRIEKNEREALLRSLNALIPPAMYDNDLLADTQAVKNEVLLGTDKPVTVYRARRKGLPVAVAFMPVIPDGYAGEIHLLTAVRSDGVLLGVRVVRHKETPGLGDQIEERRSDWIHGFAGHSLTNPAAAGWAVKRDGGIFDQFTGATVTPRAVVKAVYRSLQFYDANRLEIFRNTK
ncbi:MAG: electron transport complex subunit RsxG [Gammaproteobacteria bacterium]|nr:electron transport complex subunit RsxG [Gammaproteobacteria bacterium]